jgi:hypothetical protein
MSTEDYEQKEIEEEESEIIPIKKYSITSYGADYTTLPKLSLQNFSIPPCFHLPLQLVLLRKRRAIPAL